MLRSFKIKFLGASLAIGAPFAYAAPSAAHLLPGQCLSMADMNAALRADGQRTIVIGDRANYIGRADSQGDGRPDSYGLTAQDYADQLRQLRDPEGRRLMASFLRFTQPEKTDAEREELLHSMEVVAAASSTRASRSGPVVQRWVNTVTSNEDGSRGYQLEGNLPSGQPSTQVCVRYLLTEIQMFNPNRVDRVPQSALLGGGFDRWVTANAVNGVRPLVVARTLFGEVDDLRRGQSIVIMADLSARVGLLAMPNQNGPHYMVVQFENLSVTPAGAERLELRP